MITKIKLEIDDLKTQQRSIGESMNKKLSMMQKYEEELQSIKERAKDLILSEHAILRYLERVYKLDINKLYEEIVTQVQKTEQIGHKCRFSSDTCAVSNRTVMPEMIRTL